jgi:hypothetical protein
VVSHFDIFDNFDIFGFVLEIWTARSAGATLVLGRCKVGGDLGELIERGLQILDEGEEIGKRSTWSP